MNKQKLASKPVVIITIGLGLILALILVTVTRADYDAESGIEWQVLSGGGAPAAHELGSYALNGSLGQSIIGAASNDGLEVSSGFWYGVSREITYLYLPISINH
jgi:hypothetical protein